MTARLSKRAVLSAGALLFLLSTLWLTHHAIAVQAAATGQGGNRFTIIYAVMFAVLVGQTGVAHVERPARLKTDAQRAYLDRQIVLAIVPCYNEDPPALWATVASMIDQSRRPDVIAVVDDGSPWSIQVPLPLTARQQRRNRHARRWGWLRVLGVRVKRPVKPKQVWTKGPAAGYAEIRVRFEEECERHGVRALWIRQANSGKRHAQMAALERCPYATLVWTVDSDTISDRRALAELMKPMTSPKVASVAGIVMAANVKESLLARFTDLWFVTGQLTDRSALSALGSVWVNSGPIALYRADILRANRDVYLEETFANRRVSFSDDSLLTLFSMQHGRTVQQPTAFAFSLMPAKVSHHTRQFIRWMRGSFIRSLWRVKYLRKSSIAWWWHLQRWLATLASAALFVAVVAYGISAGVSWEAAAWMAGVPLLVGYAQTLRYMVIRRSDQSPAYQWGTWLLTPLAVVWSMVVLRGMRWWGVLTCWKTGWGTRQTVEVKLQSA